MSPRTLVIANPQSRNGRTARRLRAVEARLRDVLGAIEIELTRGPRDAERIAREGVRAGIERVIVAGGDGTLSEVVTGLLAADLGHYAEIGLLPLGTGGDMVRTLDIPSDVDAAIECLATAASRSVDAGRVTFENATGEHCTSYFANTTSLGASGLIVQLANETTKAFGGSLSFLIATLRGIARYDPVPVTLRVDERLFFEGPLELATATNGRYFGGGMRIAPAALPDDGRLDVVVVPALKKTELLRKVRLLYTGAHVDDPATHVGQGAIIEAETAGEVPIEVDGEPLGRLPLRVEVLPGALRVLCPKS